MDVVHLLLLLLPIWHKDQKFGCKQGPVALQASEAIGKAAKQLYEVVLKLRQEEQDIAAEAKRTHKMCEAARRGLHTSLLAHQDACRYGEAAVKSTCISTHMGRHTCWSLSDSESQF